MQTQLNPQGQTGNPTDTSITSAMGGGGSISNLFTTLLVAQIKNQNPLEPTDPSEFVGQLTQLSQMEALQSLKDQGTANAAMLSSLQVLALGGQVGSQVTVQTDKLTLSGEPVQIGFTLENLNPQNTLVLKGSDGSEQRIELGSRSPGSVQYTIDPAALGLTHGAYSMRVETSAQETPALEATGRLSSVHLSGAGGAMLNVAGVGQISPSLLTRFNGSAATTSH